MSNLTIRDIARMAGVSTTAVSFVLNGRTGVSDATRQKVQEIIQRTGFTPNVHTRRLNLGRSYTIHVVLPRHGNGLQDQFALETLNGIFTESKSLGYSLIFTFVYGHMQCDQILDSVRSKDCDGVILYQVADPTLISLLQQENIPFVCVDAHVPKDSKLPAVEVDYYDAARQATAYLTRHGHKRIGYIGPESPSVYHMNTFDGYMSALKDAGLTCDPAWSLGVAYSSPSIIASVESMLQRSDLPTAFLCAGDVFAIDVVKALKDHGLRVPEDISITSLDDLLIARYIEPPLSTVTFDKELLGSKAMQLLYRIMSGEEYETLNLIPTRLVERNSVKQL